MLKNKKLVGVIVLCLFGIILSILTIWWIIYHKNIGATYSKKSIVWAEKVSIDSNKLYPVTDVIDGDTLKTSIDRHNITIRLLGIDTPEVVDPRKEVQCFGQEASKETKSLLLGKNIEINLNPNYDKSDKYGRLLAYIRLPNYISEVDGTTTTATTTLFVNEFLVRGGYAHEYTYNEKKPYQYQKLFRTLESEAKSEGRGLWGSCKE